MFNTFVKGGAVLSLFLLNSPLPLFAQSRINIPDDVAFLDPNTIESGTTIDFWGSPSYGDAYISTWGESNSLALTIGSERQEHVAGDPSFPTDVTFNAYAGNPGLIKVASGGEAFFSGTSGGGLQTNPGGYAEVTGGALDYLALYANSSIVVSGGELRSPFTLLSPAASLTISGADFRVDNNLVPGLINVGDSVTVPLRVARFLTGQLTNGDAVMLAPPRALFGFSGSDFDIEYPVTLKLTDVPEVVSDQIITGSESWPTNVKAGQIAVFTEQPSRDLYSGSSQQFQRDGWQLRALPGSTVDLSGNVNVSRLYAVGSDVRISGGNIDRIDAGAGTTVKVAGGELGGYVFLTEGSTTVVTGGDIVETIFQLSGTAELKIVGTDFGSQNLPFAQLQKPGDSLVFTGEIPVDTINGTWPNGEPISLLSSYLNFRPESSSDGRVILVEAFPEDFCDLNGDANCEQSDADLLNSKMGSDDPYHDFNYDGVVNAQDVNEWLRKAGIQNLGRPFPQGDLTLDGFVDSEDLGILLNAFGTIDADWSSGDLNGDSFVNSRDLGLVLNNFGAADASPAAVPEPSTGLVLLAGMMTTFLLLRRTPKITHDNWKPAVNSLSH